MWGIGIMFLIMGSVPFWVYHMRGELKPIVLPVYKNMRRCGIGVLILSVVGVFIKEPFEQVLSVLPVLILSIWMIKYLDNMNIDIKNRSE